MLERHGRPACFAPWLPARAFGLGVCLVLAQALPVAGSDYQITDLGPGRARSINKNGQVVGDSGNGVDGQGGVGTAANQGFYFDGSTRFPLTFSAVTLSGVALSGIATDAQAINDAGVVLLHQAPISFFSYSIVRTSATSGIGLGDRGDGYLTGLNNKGDAVGWRGASPFLLVGTNVYPLVGATFDPGFPLSINDERIVAGRTTAGTAARYHFDGQTMDVADVLYLDAFSFGGHVPAGPSRAAAVNSHGDVLGNVETTISHEPFIRAFLSKNGTNIALPVFAGAPLQNLEGLGLNDRGAVVGRSHSLTTGSDRAWLHEDGRTIDLNSVIPSINGWVLNEANAINESGQIVGKGLLGGTEHAFLLSPVNDGLPRITQSPLGTQVFVSDQFALSVSVSASSPGPLTYRWQKDGADIPGTTDAKFAVNATFAVSKAKVEDSGDYRVVVSNSVGSVTSAVAKVNVVVATLAIEPFPGIFVTGKSGQTYRLESATKLDPQKWGLVTTLMLTNNPQLFIDRTYPLDPQRVYRAALVE